MQFDVRANICFFTKKGATTWPFCYKMTKTVRGHFPCFVTNRFTFCFLKRNTTALFFTGVPVKNAGSALTAKTGGSFIDLKIFRFYLVHLLG